MGITTIGQLAELEAATAEQLLGRATGAHLHALARLRDPRPVDTTRRRASIGSQRALGSRPRSVDELDIILTQIVDRLARRLRDGDRVCRTVVLRLRYGLREGHPIAHLRSASDRTAVLLAVARGLLAGAQPDIAERGITLIGVSLSQLARADSLSRSCQSMGRRARLDTVLDAYAIASVRHRWPGPRNSVGTGLVASATPGTPVNTMNDAATSSRRLHRALTRVSHRA